MVLGVGLRLPIGVESGCVPGLPPNRGSPSSPTSSSSSPAHPQARRLSLMEPEPELDPAMACGGGGIEGVAEVGVRPARGVGAEEGFCSPRKIWVMRHHGGGAPDVVFEARRAATCGVAEWLGSPNGGGWVHRRPTEEVAAPRRAAGARRRGDSWPPPWRRCLSFVPSSSMGGGGGADGSRAVLWWPAAVVAW
jgi:hypothetical protein